MAAIFLTTCSNARSSRQVVRLVFSGAQTPAPRPVVSQEKIHGRSISWFRRLVELKDCPASAASAAAGIAATHGLLPLLRIVNSLAFVAGR
jgi:hypothetical protein